jgi:hypothetical protein
LPYITYITYIKYNIFLSYFKNKNILGTMAQSNGLLIIYGIVIILIIFFLPQIYAIYNKIQNSRIESGINNIGMYDNQQPKFSQADFWPEKGAGFKPNKFGSTGASPTGGMRPHFDIPAETEVGWWATSPEPVRQVQLDIYDNSSNNGIGNKYVSAVGWWNA